jgi:hypothetical protein
MKSPSAKVAVVDPETEDTDPVQRPSVHSVAMVTAVAELGLLPTGLFGSGKAWRRSAPWPAGPQKRPEK